MLFTKSTFVALASVVAVAAKAASPSFPDWIGGKPSVKSMSVADDFALSSGGSFTLAPTVTTPAIIQTTEKIGEAEPTMPEVTPHTPHPSRILTGNITGTRGSPGNSKNISKTISVTGSSTRFPIMPIITGNGTKPTGTATPSNGTNRTTSATPTRMPISLGSTVTPYGAAFLAFIIGFIAMGL